MTDIASAIQEWKNKSITAAALLRRLVSHDPWHVPISEDAVADTLATHSLDRILYNKDDAGYTRLLVFSSDEALKAYSDAGKTPDKLNFLGSAGSWVFTLPIEGIDEVLLDAASPHQFPLSGPSVKALAATARAVQVEQALQRLRAGESHEGDLQLVAKYEDYVIAISKAPDGDIALCHAPDSDGRILAAVFSHNDAADLALDKMQAHYTPNQVVTTKSAGPQLFRMLAGMRNLDGLVFNFEGPGKAIAFAAGLSEILLAEAEK
jgi:hypothetical protein